MFLPSVILLAILLATGVLLLAATLLAMALTLLRPPRMTDGKAAYVLRRISPGDLGLEFEEMRFDVRDQRSGKLLPIAAWWIPHRHAQGRCVVLNHGYADGKVGAIAWAPTWHALGYNILAIDLRAHGYSGGAFTTAGYFERYDLDQVLDQFLAERGEQARQLVLFGVSLGAAVALGTAEMRDDIDALVLECPYAEYSHAVATHANVMQMPLPGFVPMVVRLAERISGADFGAVRPDVLLARIGVPVMVINAADDPFVPREDVEAIERAMQQRAEAGLPGPCWNVGGATHVKGITIDPEEYRRRVAQFLDALTPSPSGRGGRTRASKQIHLPRTTERLD